MKHIAILSDTHGLLREEVKAQLSKADIILHAGDVTTQAIVDDLRSFGQAYIVRGNNDTLWIEDLPHSLTVTIEGIRFFLIHDRHDIPRELPDVDIIVFGHSHRFEREERDGVLWLNPGSCGKRRFHQELTFCMMRADQGAYQVEPILIPRQSF